MTEIEKYDINIIDNEHIEGRNVKQNVQIQDLFEKAVAGNYKYYRAVGIQKIVGLGEPAQCKLYRWDETAKKGLYAGTTVEKSPEMWFENPHYVELAVEDDLITETTIEEPETELIEPTVEVKADEKTVPEQVVTEPDKTAQIENDGVDYKALYESAQVENEKLKSDNEILSKAVFDLQSKLDESVAIITTFNDEKDSLTAKATAYDNLQAALTVLKSFLA